MSKSSATAIHARFAAMAGSEYIASERAISGLMRWLRRTRPASVLEVGAGIGTLSFTILVAAGSRPGSTGLRFVALEDDDFCRRSLIENLGDLKAGVELLRDVSELPAGELFDLVVIDGGRIDEPAYFDRVASGGTVFFEGWRLKQRRLLEDALGSQRWVRTEFGRLGEKGSGYWIYRLDPSFRELVRLRARNLLNHLANRWSRKRAHHE